MRRAHLPLLTAALAAISLSACERARPPAASPGSGGAGVDGGTGGGSGTDGGTAGGSTSGGLGAVAIDLDRCTRCHGDPARGNAAPPVSVVGLRETTAAAVGAHQQHLTGATLRAPIACDDCHVVPRSTDDASAPWHSRTQHGRVDFAAPRSTGLARAKGAAPAWSHEQATCSDVYCHGATLHGGSATTPLWTKVDGSQKSCESCHGYPPPAPHPRASDCARCHPETVGASGALLVSGGKHLDGTVEIGPLACASCHGDDGRGATPLVNAAPPRGPAGETATTEVVVGAHQPHLQDGVRQALGCESCHVVPTTLEHATAGGPKVVFGGPLAAQNASATWDEGTATCSGTYCHGASLPGGQAKSPVWTRVDGSQAACGSCHGAPPPLDATSHHPQNTACATCHGAGYATTGITGAALATHLDGETTFASATPGCTSCHGDVTRAAVASGSPLAAPGIDDPAVDTHGNPATATGVATVGAHRAHLTAGPFARALACTECHAVPPDGDVRHANGVVAIAFATGANDLARTRWSNAPAIAPAFDPATATCSSVYCHGAFPGGANAAPAWTAAGSVTCGSCHAIPPATTRTGLLHPPSSACGSCHGGSYSATTVDPSMHLDGVVEVPNLTCTSCHGDVGGTRVAVAGADPKVRAAPPVDTLGDGAVAGQTYGTARGVGAHLAHVNPDPANAVTQPIACVQCHGDVSSYTTGHMDGMVEVSWGNLAGANALVPPPAPSWDAGASTLSCASIWCHGGSAQLQGGATTAPTWNAGLSIGSGTCGACHGAPPPVNGTTSFHPQNTSCGTCHGAGYAIGAITGAALTTHVDGVVEKPAAGCTACHGDVTQTGIASGSPAAAPGVAAASVDTHGNPATATGVATVGAHRAHLTAGPFANALACSECHAVPANGDRTHANGVVAVAFATGAADLARTQWTAAPAITPTFTAASATCASVYCHGAFPGGANAAPAWTAAGSVTCGSCHAIPPATTRTGMAHPASSACGSCHGGSYSATSVDLSMHMNGRVDAPSLGCTSCHGDAGGTRVAVAGVDPRLAAAPPVDTSRDDVVPGKNYGTARGVGAHLSHVNPDPSNAVARPIACAQCHGDLSSYATDHMDGTVQVSWGTVAAAGSGGTPPPAPAWDAGTATLSCASLWCHGGNAALVGGATTAPTWNAGLSIGSGTCGACHGAPPPVNGTTSFHPQNPACATCHGAGYTFTNPGGAITGAALATHVDGTVEKPAAGCTACHGDVTQTGVASGSALAAPGVAAPSLDTHGNPATATDVVTVGAHRAHLTAGAFSNALACSECHAVPANGDKSHANGVVAVAFATGPGDLARRQWPGAPAITPAFNPASATCSSVYCHGAFPGGANGAPAWTGAGTVGCGSCHAIPPATTRTGMTHPASSDCGSCHGGGYSATTVDLSMHLNGAVDVPGLTCTSCHGDLGGTRVAVAGADPKVRAAPPVDTSGGDVVAGKSYGTARGVGAHLSHVNPDPSNAVTGPIACAQCHGDVSAYTTDHMDGTVEVSWGSVAAANAIVPPPAPRWDAGTSTLSCASIWCHGGSAQLQGGATTAPTWNGGLSIGSGTCGACHGAPPPVDGATSFHPQNTSCGTCHGAGYALGAITGAALSTHVDGLVEKPAAGCTACHGDVTQTGVASGSALAAPGVAAASVDTHGNPATATGLATVGAHRAHLTAGAFSNALACSECHAVPADGDRSHANGVVAIAFATGGGDLARTQWAGAPAIAPAFDAGTLTCASVYCHGAFPGGANRTPVWTAAGTVTCGSCHALPPATTRTGLAHPSSSACGSCHGAGYSATTVDLSKHMNGVVDVPSLTCTSCHGDGGGTRVLVSGADPKARAAPPLDTAGDDVLAGESYGTARGVGAHLSHVNPDPSNAVTQPIACAQCHGDVSAYTTDHMDGTVELSWGSVAAANAGGTPPPAPAWDAGTSTLSCASLWCHGGNAALVGGATTAPTWNAGLSIGSGTCGACHGAPPPVNGTTSFHPQNPTCATCHGAGYTFTNPGGAITGAALSTHVDGTVQKPTSGCTACHGDVTQTGVASGSPAAAPGVAATSFDAHGNPASATSVVTVGAHRAHLTAGPFANALACSECHAVPANGDRSHANGVVAIAFATGTGNLAATRWSGAPAIAPAFNASNATCSSVYCHGAFPGGANGAPAWTSPGSVACGSCHAIPPATTRTGMTHPASSACGTCHGGAYSATTVDLTMHMNGAVDAPNLTCWSCHGDFNGARTIVAGADPDERGAPPYDTHGGTVVSGQSYGTSRGVGAHLAHVDPDPASAIAKPIACAQCHGDLSGYTTSHANGTVDVVWGSVAAAGSGATPPPAPSWDAGSGTLSCASVWCHGGNAQLQGGTTTTPTWNAGLSIVGSCTACHGAPPPVNGTTSFHPQNATCATCHGAGYAVGSISGAALATHVDGAIQKPSAGCTACHGDVTQTGVASGSPLAAPGVATGSFDTHGNPATATGVVTVGAHRAHLTAGPFANALACSECHAVPANGDRRHADGVVAIAFATGPGNLAARSWSGAPAVTPAFNASNATCSSVYCHGAFPGGASGAPVWTGAGTVTCGSCHAIPPTTTKSGMAHPAASACGSCHGGTYSATTVDLTMHMNGAVDVPNLSCTSCHGDVNDTRVLVVGADPLGVAAPPLDTHRDDVLPGQSYGTARGVGAHLSHVNPDPANAVAQPIACAQCHAGVGTYTTSHANGTVDVAWGSVATANGSAPGAPSWNAATSTLSCSAVWCHGGNAQLQGGSNTTPAWNAGQSIGSATCGACHGAPPPVNGTTSFHPQNAACATCHGAGYTTAGIGGAALTTHVDGTIQKPAAGCTACHGDVTKSGVASGSALAAPGVAAASIDTHGNPATATGVATVGAHKAHLTAGPFANALACSECHAVPGDGNTTHANGVVAVAFATGTGNLAKTQWTSAPAITPAFDAGTLTCASVYCHGAFPGGKNAAPVWTAAGSVACGSCHAIPPATTRSGAAHTTFTDCGSCHGGSYSATTVDLSMHMNGAVDTPTLSCSSCHGDTGNTRVAVLGADAKVRAAPPVDTKGNGTVGGQTYGTARGVGAHLAHVNPDPASAVTQPIACAQCHGDISGYPLLHANGTVNVAWGALATANGSAAPAPAWDGTSGTLSCASLWCHGGNTALVGGSTRTPTWNAGLSIGSGTCGACHGAPPPLNGTTSRHPQNPTCSLCHGAGYAVGSIAGAALTTHVDGTIQKPAVGCTACHGDLAAQSPAVASGDKRAAPGYDATAYDTHGNPATATTAAGVGAHQVHLAGGAFANGLACSECHSVPATGDVSHANGVVAIAFATAGGNLAATSWTGAPVITPSFDAGTLTCASVYCHGAFPGGNAVTATWTNPGSIVCGSCHGVPPATTRSGQAHTTSLACGGCHGGTYTSTTVDKALHMNGVLDGGVTEPNTTDNRSSCGECHATILLGMTGSKASKHTLGTDSPFDGSYTWNLLGSLTGSVPQANRSCVSMCHGDHPHTISGGPATHEYNTYLDATSPSSRSNDVSGTATSTTRDNSDFDSAQTNGGLCISCHRSPVDAASPATHPAIDKAAYTGSAHNYTSNTVGGTTYSWQFTLHDGGKYQRNCTKCHAGQDDAEGTTPSIGSTGSSNRGVHYSDNDSLLAGSPRSASTANATVPTNFICYNCHGNGAGTSKNMSGKDVFTATQKTYYHPVNTDTKHTSASEFTATFNDGAFSGANRHAACQDCHSPHAAGNTKVTRTATATSTRNQLASTSPMYGATGVGYRSYPAAWTAPTSANLSANPASATYEYQVCFKCHSAFAFGGTPPTSSGTGNSGTLQTDVAKDFNPANKSGHPVVTGLNNYTTSYAPKALAASRMVAPWATNVGTQTMLCTDCHNTDAASPAVQGPHGSAVKFMLAGTNRNWPKNGSSYYALGGSLTGLFCTNCHVVPGTNAVHANSNHSGYECVRCHIVLPHGGKVSRLIATTNTPAPYKDSGVTPGITAFHKNSSYSASDCQAGCSNQHNSASSPAEQW